MPNKAGRFTPMEQRFVERYAATGDAVYAAEKAGYGTPSARAVQNLNNPGLMREARRRMENGLANRLQPLATERHAMILEDPNAPAGAVVLAIKLVYDRLAASEGADEEKDLSEMTGEELAAEGRKARTLLAEIEARKKTIEHEPESPSIAQAAPNAGVFD